MFFTGVCHSLCPRGGGGDIKCINSWSRVLMGGGEGVGAWSNGWGGGGGGACGDLGGEGHPWSDLVTPPHLVRPGHTTPLVRPGHAPPGQT